MLLFQDWGSVSEQGGKMGLRLMTKFICHTEYGWRTAVRRKGWLVSSVRSLRMVWVWRLEVKMIQTWFKVAVTLVYQWTNQWVQPRSSRTQVSGCASHHLPPLHPDIVNMVPIEWDIRQVRGSQSYGLIVVYTNSWQGRGWGGKMATLVFGPLPAKRNFCFGTVCACFGNAYITI